MTNIKNKAIVTVPPYADYIEEVLSHPCVSGIRLNTVMPISGTIEDTLKTLDEKTKKQNKSLWIDLKTRQLRIKDFGVPPFTEITLSHEIEVDTPTRAYFSNRFESATILKVDKNRLIMQEGPKRVVGPGESVTITDPSLNVKGYLTDLDKQYIEAGNKVGISKYMLSFVENQDDIKEFREYNSGSNIALKIESVKGLTFVKDSWVKNPNESLMAARGDLFMQLHWPHKIIPALELILKKDPDAIVASRILDSLAEGPEPSSSDIGDLDNLLRMNYNNFMFGDEVCLQRSSIISALNVFSYMKRDYDKK